MMCLEVWIIRQKLGFLKCKKFYFIYSFTGNETGVFLTLYYFFKSKNFLCAILVVCTVTRIKIQQILSKLATYDYLHTHNHHCKYVQTTHLTFVPSKSPEQALLVSFKNGFAAKLMSVMIQLKFCLSTVLFSFPDIPACCQDHFVSKIFLLKITI